MGEGTNGTVNAMTATSDDAIVVAGGFTAAGNMAPSNIALYDPDLGWNELANGANGDIKSVAIDSEGNVFVGGDFTQIGGIPANNIALWSGSWSALGQGTNGPVSSIAIAPDNKVYVGGTFEMAGGTTVNNIALWSDGSWLPLTDATTGTAGTNNEVRAISIDQSGHIYIGGNFDSAGGESAPRIAVWDGTDWSTLGQGTSGFVQAIAITQEHVYAGGNFAIAGNNTVNRIARWDRTSMLWEAMGQGLSGNVNALAIDGDYLYAGGNFETASDETDINMIVNNIARWSEDKGWEALGNGTDVGVGNIVNSLTFDGTKSRLYVGGTFDSAGEDSANNIAIWSETLVLPPTNPEATELLYPNPFEHLINVEVINSTQDTINAVLYTISGILVSSKSYPIQNDLVTLEFPILSSGLYYLKIQNEDTDKAYKVIKR